MRDSGVKISGRKIKNRGKENRNGEVSRADRTGRNGRNR
jgi:hypothetical protein